MKGTGKGCGKMEGVWEEGGLRGTLCADQDISRPLFPLHP